MAMGKQYGLPFVIWWNSLWAISLGTIYWLLHTDRIEWAKIKALMVQVRFDKFYNFVSGKSIDDVDPAVAKLPV